MDKGLIGKGKKNSEIKETNHYTEILAIFVLITTHPVIVKPISIPQFVT